MALGLLVLGALGGILRATLTSRQLLPMLPLDFPRGLLEVPEWILRHAGSRALEAKADQAAVSAGRDEAIGRGHDAVHHGVDELHGQEGACEMGGS